MTTTHKIELESLLLFGFAAFAGVTLALYFNHGPKTIFTLPVVTTLQSPIPTAAPTPTVQTFYQPSPNGQKKVTMTVTTRETTSKTYLFTVSDADGSNPQTIYSINLPTNENMRIPFNTFSPDNKFLFFEHTAANGGVEAFVFRTDGQPISQDTPYYNVSAIFAEKQIPNSYQVTTGWASETLLIVNTTKSDGTKGPSYWFEVPSKAIIQLATDF